MTRARRFTLRVDETEQRMLRELSQQLQRSRSDTLRVLVREALRALLDGGQLDRREQAVNKIDSIVT